MPIIRNLGSYSESNEPSIINTSKKISNKLDLLDKKLDGLYKDIYISRPDNKNNLDRILDRLDSAIDQIQDTDINVSGMSELLRRIDSKDGSNTKNLMNSVADLFNDQNMINTLFMNNDIRKYIAGQNYQYDMICKYIPKLLDALEIKRDNVLCSDNFSDEYLNPQCNKSSKSEIEKFSSNVTKLERIHDISTFFDKTYMNVSRYGEEFIYVVPYTIAFKKLLKRASNFNSNTARLGQFSFYENTRYGKTQTETIVKEDYFDSKDFTDYKNHISNLNTIEESDDKNNFKGFPVNLHFNDSNIITEVMNEYAVIRNIEDLNKFNSLSSIYEQSKLEGNLSDEFEKIDAQNNGLSAATSDGLIIPGNLDRDPDKIDKHMIGAVIERLPRENVIPIYIGKQCMGYYYLEFAEDKRACGYCGNSHMTAGVSNATSYAKELTEDQNELAIRYIANRMSQSIDARFINANKDLKEEIYAVLRYNEKFDLARTNDIGVTFIPANDIVHCYFEFDENSHRGISDLEKSVVPAMLYILLYLTDIIGKITRSTDKRIYYVKQNVEQNVARTMMNVVQQIKKGNMGMRQIESMNNILNIVGKYNDYIIPLGQSGDPPIQFEVMQGQDIQTPTDIMEKMEEAAVNATGVPFEMLNSVYQQDFAIRFSMSNARFLKSIRTRQRKTQKFLSKIYTKIYNYEFDENNPLIEVQLPPPIYMVMQNNQQLMDNITQQADKIVELELADEEDEVKTEFKKIYTRNSMVAYIDFSQIERYRNAAKVNVEANKIPEVEEATPDDGSDYDDF